MKDKQAKLKKPTPKEKRLVEEFVKNGGNGTNAALSVYDTKNPKHASSIASKTLQRPHVQELLAEELHKQNVTLERAIMPISKALSATKTTENGEVDDLDMQLRASDRALKYLLPDQKSNIDVDIQAEVNNININIKHYEG